MDINTPASIAAFQAKPAADKVLSYMWYIHVLVRVNTEARLRANIAPVLEHSASPSFSVPVSAEGTSDRQSQKQQQHEQPAHGLSDHLVLWLFNHDILTRLVDTAPVLAQAKSYANILAAVPVPFHEEFCRRLYTLLFSKRIVEWPHGIDVPEPAIAAAEPVIIATAAAAAAEVPIELEDTHLSSEHEHEREHEHEHEDVGGAGLDGAVEDTDEACRSPIASLSLRDAPIWLGQTPSVSSWDGDDISHMERAAYFGTVSDPLPRNYFADWEWSRSVSGPGASVDEPKWSGVQPKAPFPTPQQRGGTTANGLHTPCCDVNRDEPPSPPAARWQGRVDPSDMYGDGIEYYGGEISRRCSSMTTGFGICRSGRGRMDVGHTAPKPGIINDGQHDSGLGRERDSPVAGLWSASS